MTLAVPESLQPLFAAKVVEATTMALPEDDVEEVDPEAALARILDHEHDAIVVGPGLRPGLATAELVRELLAVADEAGRRRRSSLDAEALRSLATMDALVGGDRPAGRPDPARRRVRPAAGRRAAATRPTTATSSPTTPRAWRPPATPPRRWGQVVVLKGARDGHRRARRRGRRSRRSRTRPSRRGGTGDVLAGTIGALLAQGLEPFAAARLGVYLHGLAGDAVRERLGDAGLLASDLPDGIALARKRLAAVGRAAPGQRSPRVRRRRGRRRPPTPSRRRPSVRP